MSMNIGKFDSRFVNFFDWVSDKKRADLIVNTVQSISYHQAPLSISISVNGTLNDVITSLEADIISSIDITLSLKKLLINFIRSQEIIDILENIYGDHVFTLCVDKFSSELKVVDPRAVSPSESIKLHVKSEIIGNDHNWYLLLSGNHVARFADVKLLKILETSFCESYLQSSNIPIRKEIKGEADRLKAPQPPPTIQSPPTPISSSQKRGAVYDTVDINMPYTPKYFPKNDQIVEFLSKVIKNTILFRSFSENECSAVVGAFERCNASASEVIIKQGDPGEYFYVIEDGSVDIFLETGASNSVRIGKSLVVGDYFGELALMYNTPRAATVIAAENTVLWRIDRQNYRMIATHHHRTYSEELLSLVRNVDILGNRLGDVLSSNQLAKVVASLEVENFEPGSVIIRQSQTGDYFYIIKEGTVEVWQKKGPDQSNFGRKVADLGKGAYFGEKALLEDDVRQASCIASSKVVCLCLSREDFISMLGSWQDLTTTKDHGNTRNAVVSCGLSSEVKSIKMHLEDLEQLGTIGVGAFGRVKVAQNRITGETFALKCQSKKAIIDTKVQATVLNEMHLMKLVDHPCITRFYCALQDSKNIYFVLELLLGGDFFGYLQRQGPLHEEKARFYSASVVVALKALHAKKIAFRDLKPENMVLDHRGYVKLVDFGLAKQIVSGLTWTMCGTPDYLAPEIIMNQGHNYAVDYWAFGVLLFEMINGFSPFYAEVPMKVYEQIMSGQVSFPTFFSRQLMDLSSKLLQRNPAKRLGNMKGGVVDIMKHRWFGSFDWQGLESGQLVPEYVPTIQHPLDCSNFEVLSDDDDDDEDDDEYDEDDEDNEEDEDDYYVWMPNLD